MPLHAYASASLQKFHIPMCNRLFPQLCGGFAIFSLPHSAISSRMQTVLASKSTLAELLSCWHFSLWAGSRSPAEHCSARRCRSEPGSGAIVLVVPRGRQWQQQEGRRRRSMNARGVGRVTSDTRTRKGCGRWRRRRNPSGNTSSCGRISTSSRTLVGVAATDAHPRRCGSTIKSTSTSTSSY